jgi:hypothetical protein
MNDEKAKDALSTVNNLVDAMETEGEEEEAAAAAELPVDRSLEEEQATKTTDRLNLTQMRLNFKQKLLDLINREDKNCNNLWILNEILIPLNTAQTCSLAEKVGGLRLKYEEAENYLTIHKESQNEEESLPEIPQCEFISNNNQQQRFSEKMNLKYARLNLNVIRHHIHTYFAYNQQGMISTQMIVYPQNELDQKIGEKTIKNTISFGFTANGDPNSLEYFLNWLKLFIKQQQTNPKNNNSQPLVLLLSSFMYVKLSILITNAQKELQNELFDLMHAQNVHLLFYPIEKPTDSLNQNLFDKFCDIWEDSVRFYAQRDNPNNDLSFLHIYKYCLRKLCFQNRNLISESFNKLIQMYELPLDLAVSQDMVLTNSYTQNGVHQNGHNNNNNNKALENALENNDESQAELDLNNKSTLNNNVNILEVMSEQEIDEYVEWIEEMSKIGCLSIKHTFLRDFYQKCKSNF